jgi:hypothetical protein
VSATRAVRFKFEALRVHLLLDANCGVRGQPAFFKAIHLCPPGVPIGLIDQAIKQLQVEHFAAVIPWILQNDP